MGGDLWARDEERSSYDFYVGILMSLFRFHDNSRSFKDHLALTDHTHSLYLYLFCI